MKFDIKRTATTTEKYKGGNENIQVKCERKLNVQHNG